MEPKREIPDNELVPDDIQLQGDTPKREVGPIVYGEEFVFAIELPRAGLFGRNGENTVGREHVQRASVHDPTFGIADPAIPDRYRDGVLHGHAGDVSPEIPSRLQCLRRAEPVDQTALVCKVLVQNEHSGTSRIENQLARMSGIQLRFDDRMSYLVVLESRSCGFEGAYRNVRPRSFVPANAGRSEEQDGNYKYPKHDNRPLITKNRIDLPITVGIILSYYSPLPKITAAAVAIVYHKGRVDGFMNRIFISSPIGLSVCLDGGAADISIITGAIAGVSTFDAAHFLFRKVAFLDLIYLKRFHGSCVLGFIQQIFIGFLSCDGVSGSAVLRILPRNPENYIISCCLSAF